MKLVERLRKKVKEVRVSVGLEPSDEVRNLWLHLVKISEEFADGSVTSFQCDLTYEAVKHGVYNLNKITDRRLAQIEKLASKEGIAVSFKESSGRIVATTSWE